MSDKKNIKEQAVKIIAYNFGQTTARMYGEFYKDKSENVVLVSVKELLIEAVGERKAQEEVTGLYA